MLPDGSSSWSWVTWSQGSDGIGAKLTQLPPPPAQGMSTYSKVAIGVGVTAGVALAAYLAWRALR